MPDAFVNALLVDPDMLEMGHGQRPPTANHPADLGLGWIYYGLARTARPANAIVIGSWRGFVPAIVAQALLDNGDNARLTFIDPSLVDEFWTSPERTRQQFQKLGLPNVDHHLLTTQQFILTPAYQQLHPIAFLFIDGYHSLEQVRFDFNAFKDRLAEDALVLFHDSRRNRLSRIYGLTRIYTQQVRAFLDELALDPAWQILDLPYADGVSIVRRRDSP